MFNEINSDLLHKGKKIAFGVDSFEDYKMWYEEDFVKLAESYGHVGMKIENSSDIEGALKEAFSPKLKERLVFLDFITDQTENVFPMVPNGKGLSEMILADDAEDL